LVASTRRALVTTPEQQNTDKERHDPWCAASEGALDERLVSLEPDDPFERQLRADEQTRGERDGERPGWWRARALG
jgi:hypothetical protein